MKCTECGFPLHGAVLILALVTGDKLYAGNFHTLCVKALIGRKEFDNLTLPILKAGWTQQILPGWEKVI